MSDKYYTVDIIHKILKSYDKKIKEYIEDNASDTIEGSGIEIYEDYSKLPTNLTEKTIAYCENDYVDNTDVDNPITYTKGFYLYDTVSSNWNEISIKADLSELDDILEILDNKVDKDTLDEYMDKATYLSEVNEGNVKVSDKTLKVEGIEKSQPLQYYGKNILGEMGFHFLPINTSENPAKNLEQINLLNVIAEEVYNVQSVNSLENCELLVQCFYEVSGTKDITLTVDNFDISNENFYYVTDDVTFFDDGVTIKNMYNFEFNTITNDGYYATKEINIDEFKE